MLPYVCLFSDVFWLNPCIGLIFLWVPLSNPHLFWQVKPLFCRKDHVESRFQTFALVQKPQVDLQSFHKFPTLKLETCQKNKALAKFKCRSSPGGFARRLRGRYSVASLELCGLRTDAEDEASRRVSEDTRERTTTSWKRGKSVGITLEMTKTWRFPQNSLG